ncbi:MAG: hemerythrin family protein [Gammaproteobacteria bacterium]|nr:hemerythrin family protein [Gammaproteobacteria bacterium]MCB1853140.1 hemerythrin family protein [Gammaproteobacteria bacterium]
MRKNVTMTLISWNTLNTLNVGEIDAQHHRLIALVNELHQTMTSAQGADKLNRVLLELIEFTKLHFATEEKFMTGYAYPAYEQHKKEHEVLLGDIEQLLQRFRNGDFLIPFAIELDLESWALRHIETHDKPLGDYLNSKGVF